MFGVRWCRVIFLLLIFLIPPGCLLLVSLLEVPGTNDDTLGRQEILVNLLSEKLSLNESYTRGYIGYIPVFSKDKINKYWRWKYYRLSDARWKTVVTENFIIESQLGWDLLKEVAYYCQEFILFLQKQLINIPEKSQKCRIVIYTNKDDFLKKMQATGISNGRSFYNATEKQITLLSEKEEIEEEFLQDLFHEVSHYFTHICLGKLPPVWFAEGFAEYYSNLVISKDKILLLGSYASLAHSIKMAFQSGRIRTLRELANTPAQEFYERRDPVKYLHSWSVICYLLSYDRKTFANIWINLFNNREAFFNIEMDSLDRSIKNYWILKVPPEAPAPRHTGK